MRIVVASDDISTRSAVSMLIDAQPDLELVADVADITELLHRIKLDQPDLVVLDWDDLGRRVDSLQDLLPLFVAPPTIIAFSVHEEARRVALDAGFAGFASKSDPPSELLATIRQSLRAKNLRSEP